MKNTNIQWADHTFNPWIGCTMVAPECAHCYAKTLDDNRFSKTLGDATKENPVSHWGKGAPRHRTSAANWRTPLQWDKFPFICDTCGEGHHTPPQSCSPSRCCGIKGCQGTTVHRARVFCLSLGDWLDDEVPIEWLRDLIALIHATPNLNWLLLTKRPENWRKRMQAVLDIESSPSSYHDTHLVEQNGEPGWALKLFFWLGNDGVKVEPFLNVWIGVSAGADLKAALDIPATIHFLSCEPMLKHLNVNYPEIVSRFDWIIFGGESGKNARPLYLQWIIEGLEFCRRYRILPFVKQLGADVRLLQVFDGLRWPNGTTGTDEWVGGKPTFSRIHLKDSHGGNWDEWPEELRVREIPKL